MKYLLSIYFLLSIPAYASSGDIKTTDLHNEELSTTTNAESDATVSPEQIANLKKQMEQLKENQKKSEDYLKELENEK